MVYHAYNNAMYHGFTSQADEAPPLFDLYPHFMTAEAYEMGRLLRIVLTTTDPDAISEVTEQNVNQYLMKYRKII